MAEKKFQLDIFSLMSKLDSGDRDVWNGLSEDEKKAFPALIVMRWMSGCSDYRQIIYLNTFVNPVVFQFGKHPELLMKLLGVSSSKTPKRYSWYGLNKNKKDERKLKVICEYHEYSKREALMALPLLSNEDILQYAEALGYQKEEIQLLKKEFVK